VEENFPAPGLGLSEDQSALLNRNSTLTAYICAKQNGYGLTAELAAWHMACCSRDRVNYETKA
jgi:hypothetical protein